MVRLYHRTPPSTGTFSLTEGDISSVRIEEGPANSKAGDFLYFNNDGTGGYGAEAIVEFVTGKSIANTNGEDIVTQLMSHRQRINLSKSPQYLISPKVSSSPPLVVLSVS